MIAINEQLGFKVGNVYRDWELDLTAWPPCSVCEAQVATAQVAEAQS
jgi:hypothetical protein